jgi:carboxypeptidase Taq
VSGGPAELQELRERLAELSDLHGVLSLVFWDQNTMMPPDGAAARAEHASTLQRIAHQKQIDPELGRLLDALDPWAAGEDPDSDDVRMLAAVRRDFEKSSRVPSDLAAEMSHAAALGQQAWMEARARDDFARFRDALARQFELRHRYVACFDGGYASPYDVLLDDFEPGLTTAELQPLFAELREALVPLVAATGDPDQPRNAGVFDGHYPAQAQRDVILEILTPMGFDPAAWRMDPSPHPFAQAMAARDVRITTKYDERDFGVAYYSALHEFGHGLYEANVDPAFERTPLSDPVSLGVHESQSRMWENVVGRSRAFCAWALPQLQQGLGGLDVSVDELYRSVNTVQPSLIRIEADETTYNLHIILRFELELALLEGALAIDELPQAWNEGVHRLLGVEVPSDADGVLQDIHWATGLIGYFPTYTLGNLMAAQQWTQAEADLGDIYAQIEQGEFAPLREWLRENIHRNGRKFPPRELLRRVTGDELQVQPFVDYLRAKLVHSGVLAAA